MLQEHCHVWCGAAKYKAARYGGKLLLRIPVSDFVKKVSVVTFGSNFIPR